MEVWEIQKNNILIAEFIGMQRTDLGYFDTNEVMKLPFPSSKSNTFDQLSFHDDWNWLMSVVDYIKCLDIPDYELLDDIDDGLICCELEEVYRAVVKCIQVINGRQNDNTLL